MVKLAKGAKMQGKPKKAPPPKEVEDSEEDEEMEEESSEEEMEVPVKKTPSKKTATPAKATPGKKATPAKPVATPGKKGATPTVAKNGKRAKKQESEEEEESDEEESEEELQPVTKNSAVKKPVAKKESDEEEDDDEDEEDDDEESEEEQKPVAKKLPAKKPVAKKPAKKEESEDEEDSGEEAMEIPAPGKAKKAVAAKKEESEDEDDDDDEEDDDDDEEEDDDDDDDEEATKNSAKRKKEMPKTKAAPEAKKPKTEVRNEGLSVFVANLNSTKDYDELKTAIREFFTKKDLPVQDVRLGASKRFAYVELSTAEEVEKALTLNGKKFLGSELRVEKANTPADKAKIADNKKERDARTLFVKNIPYSTTAEELQEIFENAKEIRVPTGKDGSSKGIAYVEFSSESEADKAIEEKQGAEVEGRSIFIDYTGEKSQNAERRGGPAGDSKVLLVNNLSYNATEDGLQEVFEKATSIRMPQTPQGRLKGFAFVEFPSVEDAKEAMEACNNMEVEGRTIRLEFSQAGGPQGRGSVQSKTLFVKGLSEDTTEETLKDAFDGSLNARIVTDRDTGTSKGFGFVDFSTAEDAKAAKDAMEDGEIDGNRVTLDFAKPKGDGGRGGGRGGFGGRGGGRGGFGGRGGGRGGFGGRGGGRGGFGGGRGGRGFGGRGGGGGFRGGNRGGGGQGKKIKFDD